MLNKNFKKKGERDLKNEYMEEVKKTIEELAEGIKESDIMTGKVVIEILKGIVESYDQSWQQYLAESRQTFNLSSLRSKIKIK
jgi:hypothetical protein